MDSVAGKMAAFVVGLEGERISAGVTDAARACLFNALATALNALQTPYAPVARDAAIAMNGIVPNGATLLGDGRRTTVAGACLANAALMHGRSQEDTCGAAHLGVVIVPLLLALAETRDLPLDDLIPSIVAGYEVGGLLSRTLGGQVTAMGFRSSAIFGAVAAAAAASRMLRLDEADTRSALSNVASLCGGTLQCFQDGTNEWSYQVGLAGAVALTAVELARHGSLSAPRAFEGRAGFARTFAQMEIPPDLTMHLGREWALKRVTFKPFPVCAFNQTPVIAALALRNVIGNQPIDSIDIQMNPFEIQYPGMSEAGPFTSFAGTAMSIAFCVSTTLLYGAPTVASMNRFDDPNLTALIGKINLHANPQIPTLSAKFNVRSNGQLLSHYENKTEKNFIMKIEDLDKIFRNISRLEGGNEKDIDNLISIISDLPSRKIEDIISLFRN